MAMVPLVAKEDSRRAGQHTRRDQLPDFYMNDFTRLGLRVDPCDTAVHVLEANRYGLLRSRDGLQLNLEGADQMRTVVALLEDSGVSCEILDVAEAIYQG